MAIDGLWLRELTAGVEVVYTKDSDADLFIMAEAKALRQAGAPRVVVVTGDSEISASLEYGSAMGWMTSEMYMLEMKRVRHPHPVLAPLKLCLVEACSFRRPICVYAPAAEESVPEAVSVLSTYMCNDDFHCCLGICLVSMCQYPFPEDTGGGGPNAAMWVLSYRVA